MCGSQRASFSIVADPPGCRGSRTSSSSPSRKSALLDPEACSGLSDSEEHSGRARSTRARTRRTSIRISSSCSGSVTVPIPSVTERGCRPSIRQTHCHGRCGWPCAVTQRRCRTGALTDLRTRLGNGATDHADWLVLWFVTGSVSQAEQLPVKLASSRGLVVSRTVCSNCGYSAMMRSAHLVSTRDFSVARSFATASASRSKSSSVIAGACRRVKITSQPSPSLMTLSGL